jgi:hypothetical protein
MASAELQGGQPQPNEGNLGRRQFLRKLWPGTAVATVGLGAAVYENTKRNPN